MQLASPRPSTRGYECAKAGEWEDYSGLERCATTKEESISSLSGSPTTGANACQTAWPDLGVEITICLAFVPVSPFLACPVSLLPASAASVRCSLRINCDCFLLCTRRDFASRKKKKEK